MIEAQNRALLESRLRDHLTNLYGEIVADEVAERLITLLRPYPAQEAAPTLALSEQDTIIIAYGDHVQQAGELPLKTLHQVLNQMLPSSTPFGIHILPFYPYSSDDGFSVIDYYQINPALGTWQDVQALGDDYRLMFDAVLNHISAKSEWFQAFLRTEPPYNEYFVTLPPETDLSMVTRPRLHPLLTPFATADGEKYVWTTFSDDQIDLNVTNPDVLVELIKVLLFYVKHGAQLIRLDAIAFLWKQAGTTSIHLPQTHTVIQLLRDVLNIVAPSVILVTETNVPHVENLSYFGDGINEAQMVYQFALPPLILHTLRTGNATRLTQWAQTIQRVSDRTTFFNFTASHDGIGVRPVQGIMNDAEIQALVDLTTAHGGHVSYKNNSDGTQSPYELNITYFDAITAPSLTKEQPQIASDRFLVSQAIMLVMIGVPGIYFPSLFGANNDHAGVNTTGRYRSINREKFEATSLLSDLKTQNGLRRNIFDRYTEMLRVRTSEPAFHPLGEQVVLNVHPAVFAVERIAPDKAQRVLALHNVGSESVTVPIPFNGVGYNLFDEAPIQLDDPLTLTPYQLLWIKIQ